MEQKFCQSCAMPMNDDKLYGTNKDGSQNEEYCKYCYDEGDFTANISMEEMIDVCVPHMVTADSQMTEEKARSMMEEYMPQLKRWK